MKKDTIEYLLYMKLTTRVKFIETVIHIFFFIIHNAYR